MRKFVIVCSMFFVLMSIEEVKAGRGCCSWHNGESSSCTTSGRRICNDGTVSPTCTCTPAYIYGCTNSGANNYNSAATKDDGSCKYDVYGCINSGAINYNSSANKTDGSCQFKKQEIEIKQVKYKTIYKKSKKLRLNKTKVKRKGKVGKIRITYEVIRDENNNEISKEILESKTIQKKVNKIVLKGTKK